MSLKIEEIAAALRENEIPTNKIRAIVESLQQTEENKKVEKEKGPKKEYVLIQANSDTGFAVQIEASEDAGETLNKIRAAARAYNNSRKGQKTPVRTISEAISVLPAKFLVESAVWRKTKEPVRTLSIVDNNNI